MQAVAATGHQVRLTKGDTTVNARSVLSVLTLDCHHGDEITIDVEGDQADTVLSDLVEGPGEIQPGLVGTFSDPTATTG